MKITVTVKGGYVVNVISDQPVEVEVVDLDLDTTDVYVTHQEQE